MRSRYNHWFATLGAVDGRPLYQKIAELIAADIDSGLLQPRDRMPTLRDLAALLNLNYATVARAYAEARSRGLIESRPGTGTYVKGKMSTVSLKGGGDVEMTMNSLPEPIAASVLNSIKAEAGILFTEGDLYALLRYQDFGGSPADRQAGLKLLEGLIEGPTEDRILVCPGIHSVLVALLSMLLKPGSFLCVPDLVYPGLKAIASQMRVTLKAVECDSEGPVIRSLEVMCKTGEVAAIYINPTVNNPTARTISRRRREALADVALRYATPIIEDDAYGLVPEQRVPAIANLAPQLTYYVTGLSKCFGAGLRVAYLYTPGKLVARRTAGALRALSVMSSPITNALATRWIDQGIFTQMNKLVRQEARWRQSLAAEKLAAHRFEAHPDGFHLWLGLPEMAGLDASMVATHLRSQNVGVVSGAAFCTNNNPPQAVRLCLGGPGTRFQLEESLSLLVDILEHPSQLSSIAF